MVGQRHEGDRNGRCITLFLMEAENEPINLYGYMIIGDAIKQTHNIETDA